MSTDADGWAAVRRAVLERDEAGEFDPVDPGLEATIQIARAILDEDTDP